MHCANTRNTQKRGLQRLDASLTHSPRHPRGANCLHGTSPQGEGRGCEAWHRRPRRSLVNLSRTRRKRSNSRGKARQKTGNLNATRKSSDVASGASIDTRTRARTYMNIHTHTVRDEESEVRTAEWGEGGRRRNNQRGRAGSVAVGGRSHISASGHPVYTSNLRKRGPQERAVHAPLRAGLPVSVQLRVVVPLCVCVRHFRNFRGTCCCLSW